MGRRKRNILEDDDSDSSPVSDDNDDYNGPNYDQNDPDAREERALFEDPYQRKRRRKNGKEDALYGMFASSDEDEDEGLKKKNKGGKRRSDWTKAPAFVSKAQVDLTKDMEEDQRKLGEKDHKASEDENAEVTDSDEVMDDIVEQSEPSKAASPRVRDEDEDEEERLRFGALGVGRSHRNDAFSPRTFASGGIGSSKGGIGTSKGGIGSSKAGLGSNQGGIGSFRASTTLETSSSTTVTSPPVSSDTTAFSNSFPASFGTSASTSRPLRSFVRDDAPRSGSGTPAPLSTAERVHFSKLSGTFGARMLEKMGWQAGTGLGSAGEGIVTPVESKLRPKGMGLAFKGFKEKTEQAKAEARRRGEVVSEDEEEIRPRKGRKAKGEAAEPSDAWKKPKKSKKKVEHKTYEQIIAETGPQSLTAGVGPIIDATGATLREVSSLADVSIASWTPSADPTRLPELRHNLRLINEACKSDLDGLAREARSMEDRKKWIQQEDGRLRKEVEQEAELISRLQQVHLIVDDISALAKQLESMYEASLNPFSVHFDKLSGLYPKEFEKYHLDEIVIAAIAPTARRIFAQWQPLQDPTAFTPLFKSWKPAFRMTTEIKAQDEVQVYGSSTVVVNNSSPVEKPMTPYESFIWNVWMPKVQSAVVNSWSPEDPTPALLLYEAWSSLLPPFVRDNFFDQLILPKVQRAIGDWDPKRHVVPLQTFVFPWLPHVGLRSEQILDGARRKIKHVLRVWTPTDGLPKDLLMWRDVFDHGEWDTMILKHVLPKLGTRLRDDFRINPRKQDLQPLQDVLLWDKVLRPSILAQLLQKEFFPKWLDVLHIWLIQPKVNLEEIRVWFGKWKETFSEEVQGMPVVAQGFTRGLQLINKALELGPDAPTKLPKPDHSGISTPSATPTPAAAPSRPSRTQEISFRTIVEEFAAAHNLLFFPTGRVHEKSRMPLYRISQTSEGKGGLLIYIQDDAVWAPDGEDYRAIPLESMVLRAAKGN